MLIHAVEKAINAAYKGAKDLSHAQRSAAWVSALADELRACSEAFAADGEIVVFCRANERNRPEFRTNELLFDILVAEIRTVQSVRGKRLQALSKALWVVESELKRTDSRDVLIDLNKLVVAQAINKILVISGSTSLVDWAQKMMAMLLDPKESNVFLVTIPHPADWSEPFSQRAEVYQMTPEAHWLTVGTCI